MKSWKLKSNIIRLFEAGKHKTLGLRFPDLGGILRKSSISRHRKNFSGIV